MRLQNSIRDEIGITVSVGLSGTKSLAKMASDRDKPDGDARIARHARGAAAAGGREAEGLGRSECMWMGGSGAGRGAGGGRPRRGGRPVR